MSDQGLKWELLDGCNLCNSDSISAVDVRHNLFRCRDCGCVFDNPRPAFGEIEAFYSRESQYDSWLGEERGRDALWLRRTELVRRFKSAGTLLDVGAGIGQFLHFARDHFQVEGTEVSESAIGIAKEKYDLDLERGQIEDIDFGDRRFDVITLFHVLEHVPNPSLVLKACHGLLTPTGVLVIAVPNEIHSLIKRPIRRLLSILKFGKFKNYGTYGLPRLTLDGTLREIHLTHFTVSSLKRGLSKENFIVVEDALDPYYAAAGIAGVAHGFLYSTSLFIKKALKVNLYDTIWMVAKRA